MGDLIKSIPVYRPQQQPSAVNVSAPVNNSAPQIPHGQPFQNIQNQFPQTQTYTYIPAKPLGDPHNRPIGVRPQPSKARLVHENFFQSIGSTIKSYGDYAKYFYNAAFKGEGKDYNVGKINDLSIRAGSLGIAAVLATSKMFPFAKGMEFVGLGTWFASMAIWPHILGAPIKALYGVNINKEYIDSEGRRKYVYEDNQYRPMDIYRYADLNGKPLSPEEYYQKYDKEYVYLDKMGDKLGVPRNIKNRNEATMNRANQVAVQGKTLCMMTAGVMTPVVSSIAADALQTPLKNYIEKTRYNKAEAKIQNLDKKLDEILNSGQRDVNKVMEALNIQVDPKKQAVFEALIPKDGVIAPKQFDELAEYLDKEFLGSGFKNSMVTAMKNGSDMTDSKIFVNQELKEELAKISSDSVKELVAKIPPGLKDKFPANLFNYNGLSIQQIDEIAANVLATEVGYDEAKRITAENISRPIGYNAKNALMQSIAEKTLEPFTFDKIFDKKKKAPDYAPVHNFNRALKNLINARVKAYFDSQKCFVIDKTQMQKIFNFAYTNNELQNRLKAFERTSIQNISESMTAINWERVPKKYLKSMGFNAGEIAMLATQDATAASKVLSKRFSEIVKDKEAYKKVIADMSKYAKTAISKEEKAIIQLLGTSDKKGTLMKVKELMESVAQNSLGYNVKDALAMHYKLRMAELHRKYRNTIDSYVRPIKALDLFKNLDKAVNEIIEKDSYGKASAEAVNNIYALAGMTIDEKKASLKEYLKDIILQKNDINSWTTKMETELPGAKQGLKHSLESVRRIANQVFGNFSDDTIAAINDAEFVKKCDINNRVMKTMFLRIKNKLLHKYTTEINGFYHMIIDLMNNEPNRLFDYNILSGAIEEKRLLYGETRYREVKNLLNKIFNNYRNIQDLEAVENEQIKKDVNELAKELDFHYSNKAISQRSGKNVTDFFINAAQETRARNKWTKLVYGLLGGTLAVSALTIALMGKENHFNKYNYEYINTPEGAGK